MPEPDRLHARTCPVCDVQVPDDSFGVEECEECGYVMEADEPALVLAGERRSGVPVLLLGLGVIAFAAPWMLLLGTPTPAFLVTTAGVLAILSGIMPCEAGPESLVLSPRGVAVVSNRRVRHFARWHLFEEARFAPASAHAAASHHAPGRWDLTLVNAYKPSISTFLHSRGTDAHIFVYCVEFMFEATATEVEQLHGRLNEYIERSAVEYRALKLKEMDRVPPNAARVLRLRRCPSCDSDLSHAPAEGRCVECGFERRAGMFMLEGSVLRTPLSETVAIMSLLLATLVSGAAGHPQLAALFAGLLLTLGLILAVRGLGAKSQRSEPRFLVTAEGIEQWSGQQTITQWRWSELHEVRWELVEFERVRIALWDEPKRRISYSRMLFTWFCDPPGRPVVDVVLRGDQDRARLICDEIILRMS